MFFQQINKLEPSPTSISTLVNIMNVYYERLSLGFIFDYALYRGYLLRKGFPFRKKIT